MLTAQELRTQRQQHNQTQADLAKSLGVDEKVIAGYESGTAPVSNDHEEKLKKLWHPAPAAKSAIGKPTPVKPVSASPVASKPASMPPAPVKEAPVKESARAKPEAQPKKAETARMPSVTHWLEGIANDRPERPAKPAPAPSSGNGNGHAAAHNSGNATTSSAATAPVDHIVQAAAQVTNDKQRRAALDSLLTAAAAQITTVFTEDKQVSATAEAIEKLQPAHRQVILGLIEQLEQVDRSQTPPKGKLPAQDQILQTLKGQTPYETALNYLNAAIQLLKQADVADRTPLVSRLQGLSDFDRGTVNMMTKRYQESRRQEPKPEDKPS